MEKGIVFGDAKLAKEPVEVFRVWSVYQTVSKKRKYNALVLLLKWVTSELENLKD